MLRKPTAAIFSEIIKFVLMFIQTMFTDLKQVKQIRNYMSKHNLYLHFLIKLNLLICGKNC